MVRSETVPDQLVVFERAELDGRVHARWALRAEFDPTPAGSAATMRLSYSGSLWTGGLLDRVLEDEIRRGSASLIALVTAGTTRAAVVAALEYERETEALAQRLAREHVVDRPLGDRAPVV